MLRHPYRSGYFCVCVCVSSTRLHSCSLCCPCSDVIFRFVLVSGDITRTRDMCIIYHKTIMLAWFPLLAEVEYIPVPCKGVTKIRITLPWTGFLALPPRRPVVCLGRSA